MENLNEGFRFRPTDAEGLTFLLRFIAGHVMNDSGFITTNVDTYGKQEPWEIYTNGVPCGDDDGDCSQYRFFITKLKKKYGSRYSRNVGNKGTWKQQDKGKPVQQGGGPVIGYKKSMSYTNKGYDQKNGPWLMKEYELCSAILDRFEDDCRHFVLCAIKKRTPKESIGETPAFLKFQESTHEEAVESTRTTDLCRNLECKTPAFLKFQESTHEESVESTSTTNLCRNLECETPAFLKFKESTHEEVVESITSTTNYDAGDYNMQCNSVLAPELHQQINKDLEVVGGMFHDMHEDEEVSIVVDPLLAPYTIEATSMLNFDLPDLNPWDVLLEADDIYQILHEPEIVQMEDQQQHTRTC